MTDPRHVRARELFTELIALRPSEREAELARRCAGDPELRREVAELLAYHESLDTCADVTNTPVHERFLPGDLYAGRYRIVARLGRGGMGDVYRAHDTVLDVPVAIKLLHVQDPVSRSRLLNEVRLAREVNHRAVCRLYDIGESDGELFFSMEWVDGEDLHALLARVGRLPAERVVHFARQLCGGLAAAHAKGVLHRDLKPANILVDDRGSVRITDFGIATTRGETHSRGLVGTPGYMAPEQLRASGTVSEQTDIYALGLVLYELLTGRPAWRAGSVTELARQQLKSRPISPSRLVDGIPEALERIVLRCLEADPEDRPSSALAVAAALPNTNPRTLADEAGVTYRSEMVADGMRAGLSRRAARWTLVATLILIAVVTDSSDEDGSYASAMRQPPTASFARLTEAVRRLGWSLAPSDGARGLITNWSATSVGDSVLTWQRALEPADRSGFRGDVLLHDADQTAEGSIAGGLIAVATPDGHLRYFEQRQRPPPEASPEPAPAWEAVLELTGCAPGSISEIPAESPVLPAASWRSWQCDIGGTPVRVDAAVRLDRIVFVSVEHLREPTGLATIGSARQHALEQRGAVLSVGPLLVILIGAGMAWRGRRRLEQNDRRLAARAAWLLLATVVLHQMIAPAIHPFDYGPLPVLTGLLGGILQALMVWVALLAVTSSSRMRWPRTLRSVRSLTVGDLRDPSIGTGLLLGACGGALWATVLVLWGPSATGVDPITGVVDIGLISPAERLAAGLGIRETVAAVLVIVPGSIVDASVRLLALVELGGLLHRKWLGATVLAAVQLLLAAYAGGGGPAVWCAGVVGAVVLVGLLWRVGLLAATACVFSYGLLLRLPITDSFDAWYAGAGIAGITIVAALAVVGYRLAALRR